MKNKALLLFFLIIYSLFFSQDIISQGKPVIASNTHSSSSTSYITDGKNETAWNAGNGAKQFVEIDLQSECEISSLKLNPEISPSGKTSQEIWMQNNNNNWSLAESLDLQLSSGNVIERKYDHLKNIRKVRIQTNSSPSWVAWREIEIYGKCLALAKNKTLNNTKQSSRVKPKQPLQKQNPISKAPMEFSDKVKIIEHNIYYTKGDGASFEQLLNSSDKNYKYQNLNVFVIGKVKNFSKEVIKAEVKVIYRIVSKGQTLFSVNSDTKTAIAANVFELKPNEEKIFATYHKLKRQSTSFGLTTVSVDIDPENPYSVSVHPFEKEIPVEITNSQNELLTSLKNNGNIPLLRGWENEVSNFKDSQRAKCGKCEVDWNKTVPIKSYINWLGNLDTKNGEIIMKNGQKYEFSINNKGYFYFPEFGISTKYSNFEDLIKVFIKKCEEKFCGF